MKELAKYSGAIVMLISVLVLAIPFFRYYNQHFFNYRYNYRY